MPSPLARRRLLPALLTAVLTASVPLLAAPATADDPTPSPSPSSSPSTSPSPSPSPSASPSASPSPSSTPAEPEPAPKSDGPDDTEPAPSAAAFSSLAVTAAATPADAEVVAAAADWLAGQLSEAGTVTGSYPGDDGAPVEYTDWGQTLDSALALLAAGGHDAVLGRALNSVEDPGAVAAYTQGAPGDGEDAAYVGATAKLAFVVAVTGGDPESVGGVDLLAQLTSLAQPDGRFADRSDFGNYANLYGHAFALLAYEGAGGTPTELMVQGLLDAQCDDGSFPETYPGAICSGQIDATGLVLQALAAVGLGDSTAAADAVAWLTAQQADDGRFPGEAPVNSTGYAVLGLNAVDEPSGDAVAWLVSQQNDDGGLRLGAGDDASSDVFATAQALPALAGTTFAGSARAVSRSAAPETSPTPTATPSAVGQVDPTATPTASSSLVLGGSSDRGAQAASSDPLPRTGSDLGAVLAVGILLLVVGLALIWSARTRPRARRA